MNARFFISESKYQTRNGWMEGQESCPSRAWIASSQAAQAEVDAKGVPG